MKSSVVIERFGYEASAPLDNLRYIARRLFCFRASQHDMKAPQPCLLARLGATFLPLLPLRTPSRL